MDQEVQIGSDEQARAWEAGGGRGGLAADGRLHRRELPGAGRQAPLRELGLTPGHLKALVDARPRRATPMRALADALACDASMVTLMTDRLEERGLVERRTSRPIAG